METVTSIEQQLVKINKDLPKLPKGLTKWLAEYAWLLTLIGVVLSVLTLLAFVPLLLTVFGVLSVANLSLGLAGYPNTYGSDALGWFSIIVSIVSSLIVLYLEATAITPLKAKQYRGWQLLFCASLISLALTVVSDIITMQVGSIIMSLVFSAIGFYILFQLRPYFASAETKTADKKPAFKASKTAIK